MKIDDDEPGPCRNGCSSGWRSGDLPPAQARALADRVAREPGRRGPPGAARRLERGDPRRPIPRRRPRRPFAGARPRARRRAAAARPRGRAGWLLGVPTLALGAAVLLLWLRPGTGTRPTTDGDRIKGAPRLHVYRKTGKSVERLPDGAVARAGDELQLAYVASGHRFGAVVSLDGAGRVTFHLPEGGGRAVPLRAGGEVTLPESYQLDAAPRFERFLLVAGDAPFDTATLADVIRGARAAARGDRDHPLHRSQGVTS